MALIGTMSFNFLANTAHATGGISKLRLGLARLNKDVSGFSLSTSSLFKGGGAAGGGGGMAGPLTAGMLALRNNYVVAAEAIQTKAHELQSTLQDAGKISWFDAQHVATMKARADSVASNVARINAVTLAHMRATQQQVQAARTRTQQLAADIQGITTRLNATPANLRYPFPQGTMSKQALATTKAQLAELQSQYQQAMATQAKAQMGRATAIDQFTRLRASGNMAAANARKALAAAEAVAAANAAANAKSLAGQIRGLQLHAYNLTQTAKAYDLLAAAANRVWAVFMKISKIGLIGGAIGGILAARRAAQTESTAAQFETMLGSKGKAMELMADIRGLALKTPLTFAGTSQAAKMLLNYKVPLNEIIPRLRMLGDLSGADEERMHGLAIQFGQSQIAGRLLGQDLRIMIENGFNPLKEINRTTGESVTSLYVRMHKGAITAKEVADAFESATAAGGNWHGNLLRQSKTVAGAFGEMKDTFGQLGDVIGNKLRPLTLDLIHGLTKMFQWMQNLNQSSVAGVAKFTAFVGTFALTSRWLWFGTKAVMALAAAFRTLIAAEVIAEAFSGPAGWAALIGGAAAATLALKGVGAAFNKLSNDMSASRINVVPLEARLRGLSSTASKFSRDIDLAKKRIADAHAEINKFHLIDAKADPAKSAAAIKKLADAWQEVTDKKKKFDEAMSTQKKFGIDTADAMAKFEDAKRDMVKAQDELKAVGERIQKYKDDRFLRRLKNPLSDLRDWLHGHPEEEALKKALDNMREKVDKLTLAKEALDEAMSTRNKMGDIVAGANVEGAAFGTKEGFSADQGGRISEELALAKRAEAHRQRMIELLNAIAQVPLGGGLAIQPVRLSVP